MQSLIKSGRDGINLIIQHASARTMYIQYVLEKTCSRVTPLRYENDHQELVVDVDNRQVFLRHNSTSAKPEIASFRHFLPLAVADVVGGTYVLLCSTPQRDDDCK
jgi:hypothetical protein